MNGIYIYILDLKMNRKVTRSRVNAFNIMTTALLIEEGQEGRYGGQRWQKVAGVVQAHLKS